MDERLQIFGYALCGAGVFGLLGALFGALAGVMMRLTGRAAGSYLGITVAAAFARARGRPLSDVAAGLIIGGTDGACFLGVAGVLAGAAIGYVGKEPARLLWNVTWAGGLLTLGAVFFGGLAYGVVRAGAWVVGLSFAVACAGGILGFVLDSGTGLFLGAAGGALLGSISGALLGLLTPDRTAAPPSPEEPPEEDVS